MREQRRREEKEKEEKEATAREEEGRETTTAKVEVGEEEEEAAAETQGVPLACASEPQTTDPENPKTRAQVTPAILRRPHAPAPIEVAGLELVQ